MAQAWDAEGNAIEPSAWDAQGKVVSWKRALAPTPASRSVPERQDVVRAAPAASNPFQGVVNAITGEGRGQKGVREFSLTDVDRNPDTGASGFLSRTAKGLGASPGVAAAFRDFGSGLDGRFSPEGQAIDWGFFLDPNERSRAEIVRRSIPTSEFRRDEYGNLQVRTRPNAPWVYLNRPGLSVSNALEVVTEGVKQIPAAIASATPPGMAARLAVAPIAAGATMAASQSAAVPFGGRGPQTGDVAASALGGLVGQGLGEGAYAASQILSRPKPSVRLGDAVEDAGAAWKSSGTAAAQDAVTPNPTMAAYEQADEFGIPLTRGQASGVARARQAEDDMMRGGSTEAAQNIMGRFNDRQAAAIQEAGTRIATRGSAPLGQTIDDAGMALQTSLAARRSALQEQVDEAYKVAFKAAEAEKVAASDQLGARVAQVVDDEFLNAPQAMSVVSRLQDLIAQGKATYGTIERGRQALNRIAQTAADAQDNATLYAVQRIKGELDDWAAESMQTPAAKKTFEASRQIFSELKQLYGASGRQDIGGRAVERAIEIERTGQQIAESLLGAGNRPPQQALAAVRRVKEIATTTTRDGRIATRPGATAGARGFSKGSVPEELQALREATMYRVLNPLERRAEGGLVPAQTVVTNLEAALDGPNAQIMAELFTPDEVLLIRRYVDVLKRIIPPPGVNTSGTAPAVMRMIQSATGNLFNRLFGIVSLPVQQVTSQVAAQRAISRPEMFIQLPQRSFSAHGAALAQGAVDPEEGQ